MDDLPIILVVIIIFGAYVVRALKGNNSSEEEKFSSDITKLARQQNRASIELALKSFGADCEYHRENSRYCSQVSALITEEIMQSYGTNISDCDNVDILTGGIFLLTIINHTSRVLDVHFEAASTISIMELFSKKYDFTNRGELDKLSSYIPQIINLYNETATKSKITTAIGQNLVIWIEKPTNENFLELVKLYGLCRGYLQ
jgi:hypothetical protein